MKYLDEFRAPAPVRAMAEEIGRLVTRPWTLMEICGGQTHAIVKYGLTDLLPRSVRLVHGPGCPVCVTPLTAVDRAITIARTPGVIFCSFGDMLRVPGSQGSLFSARALGGDVRVVYSPLDALDLARAHPDRQVVFFAIGFETTAPTTAMAVRLAKREGLGNFSLLVAHVLVPPALEIILGSPDNQIQGLLAPGHVCTVTGTSAYLDLSRRFRIPVAVAGFEPSDLMQGLLACLRLLETGEARLENPYGRSVRPEGNPRAQAAVTEIFRAVTRDWRGIGPIPEGGLALRDEWARFDAERRFGLPAPTTGGESPLCRAGQVLQGTLIPTDCPAFGDPCTPETPLGAPMVSAEGACAAYFHFRRPATPGGPGDSGR